MQNPALAAVKFHRVVDSPALRFAKISLQEQAFIKVLLETCQVMRSRAQRGVAQPAVAARPLSPTGQHRELSRAPTRSFCGCIALFRLIV